MVDLLIRSVNNIYKQMKVFYKMLVLEIFIALTDLKPSDTALNSRRNKCLTL